MRMSGGIKFVNCSRRVTSPNSSILGAFTDRDQGEGFVLSATTRPSRTTKGKHVKTNGIDAAGVGPMEGHLLGMGEQV